MRHTGPMQQLAVDWLQRYNIMKGYNITFGLEMGQGLGDHSNRRPWPHRGLPSVFLVAAALTLMLWTLGNPTARAAQPAVVSGQVKDALGRPLGDVQVRLESPDGTVVARAQSEPFLGIHQINCFERDGAIETLLMGAIDNSLTTSANFLEQLIITEVCEHLCGTRSARRWNASSGLRRGFVGQAERVDRLRRSRLTNDPVHRFVLEQTKPTLQEASWANFECCVAGDLCSAGSANPD